MSHISDSYDQHVDRDPARRWLTLAAGTIALTAGCTFQYGLAYLIPALIFSLVCTVIPIVAGLEIGRTQRHNAKVVKEPAMQTAGVA